MDHSVSIAANLHCPISRNCYYPVLRVCNSVSSPHELNSSQTLPNGVLYYLILFAIFLHLIQLIRQRETQIHPSSMAYSYTLSSTSAQNKTGCSSKRKTGQIASL